MMLAIPLELSYTEERSIARLRALDIRLKQIVPRPEPDQSEAQQSQCLPRAAKMSLRNAVLVRRSPGTSLADAKARQ